MNITPVNFIRFGEITSSDVENIERKINDLQAVLERKELADIKREAERNNKPYYPPSYNPYPTRNPYGPHGMPGRHGHTYGYPYGQPYGPSPYGMPAGQPYGAPPYTPPYGTPYGNPCGAPYGQPYGNPAYPPLNGQPPTDTYGNPPRY